MSIYGCISTLLSLFLWSVCFCANTTDLMFLYSIFLKLLLFLCWPFIPCSISWFLHGAFWIIFSDLFSSLLVPSYEIFNLLLNHSITYYFCFVLKFYWNLILSLRLYLLSPIFKHVYMFHYYTDFFITVFIWWCSLICFVKCWSSVRIFFPVIISHNKRKFLQRGLEFASSRSLVWRQFLC